MGNLNDPQEFRRKLERYEEKLEASESVAEADRKASRPTSARSVAASLWARSRRTCAACASSRN